MQLYRITPSIRVVSLCNAGCTIYPTVWGIRVRSGVQCHVQKDTGTRRGSFTSPALIGGNSTRPSLSYYALLKAASPLILGNLMLSQAAC